MKAKVKRYLSVAVASIPAGKPIVFWDTCAILELLRLSERSAFPERDFLHYSFLAEKIKSGEIVSVTSELVFQEFHQHYFQQLKALQKLEQKTRDDVKKITAIMPIGKKRKRIEDNVDSMHTETRITLILSQIWRNTILIREQKSFLNFAYLRVKLKMAPSQNKEQFKDSYIWGTFLSLAHKLPACPKMCFFSLNISDYQEPGTNNLCAQIRTELQVLPNAEVFLILGKLFGVLKQLFP